MTGERRLENKARVEKLIVLRSRGVGQFSDIGTGKLVAIAIKKKSKMKEKILKL